MTAANPPADQAERSFTLTGAWLLASVFGLGVMLLPAYSASIGGHAIPVGNDSFYHASRILDLLADPSSLHEFDTRIHAPEGSLITWPWGYDFFMSVIARVGLALGLSSDAIAILDSVPVAFFPLLIALVMRLGRHLGLSKGATAVAAFATALFPFNQALYAVGNIDHHYAEQLFVVGSLVAVAAWFRHPQSPWRAAICGVVLGVASCIHNGLFVLQLPVDAAFLWMWLRRQPLPQNTPTFGVALILAALAISIPSQSFREMRFEFATLSWLHLYVATCSALTCVALSRLKFTAGRLVGLLILCAGLIAPLAGQIVAAGRFLNATVEGMQKIAEAQSPWQQASEGSVWDLARYYSLLIFVMPLTAVGCAWKLWKEADPSRTFFWIACLFGLAMVSTQLRLHYFGSYALYLPLILLVDQHFRSDAVKVRQALTVLALALLIAYLPGLKFTLITPKIAANDPYYALTYDIFPDFARECAQAPGIALATLDDGHFIRYHTKCSVIANNFLLTPLHEQKVREQAALMKLSPQELRTAAPFVSYVYVRRASLFSRRPDGGLQFLPGGDPSVPDPRLVNELLAADPAALPTGYRLVKELAFEKPAHIVYARVFRIDP